MGIHLLSLVLQNGTAGTILEGTLRAGTAFLPGVAGNALAGELTSARRAIARSSRSRPRATGCSRVPPSTLTQPVSATSVASSPIRARACAGQSRRFMRHADQAALGRNDSPREASSPSRVSDLPPHLKNRCQHPAASVVVDDRCASVRDPRSHGSRGDGRITAATGRWSLTKNGYHPGPLLPLDLASVELGQLLRRPRPMPNRPGRTPARRVVRGFRRSATDAGLMPIPLR